MTTYVARNSTQKKKKEEKSFAKENKIDKWFSSQP